jgi:hypothetical protein
MHKTFKNGLILYKYTGKEIDMGKLPQGHNQEVYQAIYENYVWRQINKRR